MTGSVNVFSLIAPVAHAPRSSNRGRSLTSQDALDRDTFPYMISPFRAECLNRIELQVHAEPVSQNPQVLFMWPDQR
jgi:hypothetical protein